MNFFWWNMPMTYLHIDVKCQDGCITVRPDCQERKSRKGIVPLIANSLLHKDKQGGLLFGTCLLTCVVYKATLSRSLRVILNESKTY